MCADLKAHRLTPPQWQTAIAALYTRVSLEDVLKLIDFDNLMRGVQYPPNMAAIKYVPLPMIDGMPDDFGHKIFALRKGIDDHWATGRLLTMSDEADNGHWLVAETDTAATFDVPVWGLGTRSYPTPGNDYNMIFVDPRGTPDTTTGLIEAPILPTDKAFTTFG